MIKVLNKKIAVSAVATTFNGQPIIENGKAVEKILEYSYSELIWLCVKRQGNPQTGYSYDEIKSIDRVKSAVDNIDDKQEMEFHETDFDFVKERVSSMSWGIPAIEFVEFRDYIKDLK